MSRKPRSVRIFERDGYRCTYCGISGHDATQMTLDHIIPKSRGGSERDHNLTPACQPCNTKKGNLTPAEAGMPLPADWPFPLDPVLFAARPAASMDRKTIEQRRRRRALREAQESEAEFQAWLRTQPSRREIRIDPWNVLDLKDAL